jgi:hypothetical protein
MLTIFFAFAFVNVVSEIRSYGFVILVVKTKIFHAIPPEVLYRLFQGMP